MVITGLGGPEEDHQLHHCCLTGRVGEREEEEEGDFLYFYMLYILYIENHSTIYTLHIHTCNGLMWHLRKAREAREATAIRRETYVASNLIYGCEVWGFSKSENIERIHSKCIKWLLNLKPSTNSLYAEVGRIPLYICRY